jgi:threonine dehydrogenase-like Zn-dependent dehydrogenase
VAETISMVKPRGIVLLVGVSPKGQPLPIDLYDFHFRELSVHCAYGRGASFRRALALMPSLAADALITARFPLHKVEEAFAHAAAGRGIKTVLTPIMAT